MLAGMVCFLSIPFAIVMYFIAAVVRPSDGVDFICTVLVYPFRLYNLRPYIWIFHFDFPSERFEILFVEAHTLYVSYAIA